jgi:hypothetical protein
MKESLAQTVKTLQLIPCIASYDILAIKKRRWWKQLM